MKCVIILVCLITVSFGNPYAGNIDLGAVTKTMAGTDTDYISIYMQGTALWFSKGDVDSDRYLTHQEIYDILKDYSGSDVNTCHRTASLIISKGDVIKRDGQLDSRELMAAFNWFAFSS